MTYGEIIIIVMAISKFALDLIVYSVALTLLFRK